MAHASFFETIGFSKLLSISFLSSCFSFFPLRAGKKVTCSASVVARDHADRTPEHFRSCFTPDGKRKELEFDNDDDGL
jgi:hypothetical protein